MRLALQLSILRRRDQVLDHAVIYGGVEREIVYQVDWYEGISGGLSEHRLQFSSEQNSWTIAIVVA